MNKTIFTTEQIQNILPKTCVVELNSQGNISKMNINGKPIIQHTTEELMHIIAAYSQIFETDVSEGLEELSIAKNRVATLQANIDNDKISDANFRSFVKTIDFFKM